MCGFVGILNKEDLPVRRDTLQRMADTIHHRGPDEEGLFIHGNCGFYHKRLSIIDLKTGMERTEFLQSVEMNSPRLIMTMMKRVPAPNASKKGKNKLRSASR